MNVRKLLIILCVSLLAFATPSSQAQEDDRPFIGVSLTGDGVSGILVTQVVEGAPADEAGIEVSDVIVTLDDAFVTASNLAGILEDYAVGDTVTLGVLRDDETLMLEVTFAARPTDDELEAAATEEATPQRARLGVSIEATADNTGALVVEVAPESAAAAAGLEAGDIITTVDDTTITTPETLIEVIGSYAPDDVIEVAFTRDDAPQTVEATLGAAPAQPGSPADAVMVPVPGGVTFADGVWTVTGDELTEFDLQQGDVIIEINGEAVNDLTQGFEVLQEAIFDNGATLTIERGEDTLEIEVPVQAVTALIGAVE